MSSTWPGVYSILSLNYTEEGKGKGKREEGRRTWVNKMCKLVCTVWKSWFKTQHSKNKDHGILSHHFLANRWGNNGNSDRLYFLGLQNHCRWWLQPWNQKTLAPWKKSCDNPRQHIKKERHYFADKVLSSQAYGFSGSHVWLWELDYKESWVPKNWCFWTVVLEKTLESPLMQGHQTSQSCRKSVLNIHWKDWCWSWDSIILWPLFANNWLIWKDPGTGKDWRHEEKEMTEDEMVGWHHWLYGREFEQAPGAGSLWWTGKAGVLRSMG